MIETASAPSPLVGVHHQRDVFEEAGEVLELLHRADELFQVFEPAGGVGRAVLLPHLGVAGLVEDDLGELGVRQRVLLRAPAVERRDQVAQRAARLRLQLLGLGQQARRLQQRHVLAPRMVLQRLQRRVAEAAPRRVDDALEGEIVGRLVDQAQIGERVADFGALVEARAADHAIGQAERDEAIFELAHLERGAHQDRDLVERVAARAAGSRSPRRSRALPPPNPTRR